MFKTLCRRMDEEVIAEWVKKNREHEIQSMAYLQKCVDTLCDDFNAALESQLPLDPDMEIESFKDFIKSRKLFAVSCFDRIWKPYNAQIQEARKSKLEKHLKSKEEEMIEKHELHLEGKMVEKGKRLLGEVISFLLERSRQLKSYVDNHQGRVAMDILKGMVEEIREYLISGKGNSLKERHEEIYVKLADTLDGEKRFLTEELKEQMPPDDLIEYAKGFDGKLRSHCFGSGEAQEMEYDTNERERDPNEQSRLWTTVQDILNELEEEQQDSMGVEDDRDGMNNCISVEGPGQSTEKIKTHPPRRLLKRSVKNTGPDSNDPAMKGDVTATNVQPTNKQETGREVVCKMVGRGNEGVRRRSSRLKTDTDSDSIPAQRTFRKRHKPPARTEKRWNDLDVAEKLGGDVEEASQTNCEDDESVQRGIMGRTRSTHHSGICTNNGKESGVVLKGSVMKTKCPSRANVCMTSSKTSRTNSNSMKSERRTPCRSNDKMCPKQITLVKGDYPRYSCDVCKTKFKNRKYVIQHGEFCGTTRSKPFICDECGKGFLRKDNLVRHIRVHTGEKRFECLKCSARFTRKEKLEAHIRGHDNGNLFICTMCNLTFVSKLGLHAHNLEAHEAKLPFACSHCENRFDRMYKLRNHVITHADERPFQCAKCEHSCVWMSDLIRHCEVVHSQTKQMAQKLAYDACVAYLLKETKDESYRVFPADRIKSAVVNYVIKKAKLQLPGDISVAIAPHKKSDIVLKKTGLIPTTPGAKAGTRRTSRSASASESVPRKKHRPNSDASAFKENLNPTEAAVEEVIHEGEGNNRMVIKINLGALPKKDQILEKVCKEKTV